MVALTRTCRAEWARLWTVRTTWWFAAVTSVAALGLGVLLGTDAASGPTEVPARGAWAGGRIVSMFVLVGLLATAVVATTGDHVTRGIVPTLQWTPRRGVLLTARAAVVVATLTALGGLIVAGASVVVRLVVPAFALDPGVGVRVVGEATLVFGLGCLLAVGLGLLTRSTAGGLVLVFALVLVLPVLFGNLPFEVTQRIYEWLPGTAVVRLLPEEGPPGMTPATARALLAGWAGLALAAGGWRLLRTDADR